MMVLELGREKDDVKTPLSKISGYATDLYHLQGVLKVLRYTELWRRLQFLYLSTFAVCDNKKIFAICLQDGTVCGIYHWSGSECMTKYEMVVAMGAVFGVHVDHLHADNSPPSGPVRRPHDTHLASKKVEALGIGRRTAFRDGISECLKPFV